MKQYVYLSRREECPAPVLRCMCCGGALFPGEVYYDLGGVLCQACTDWYVARRLRPYRRQAASVEVVR